MLVVLGALSGKPARLPLSLTRERGTAGSRRRRRPAPPAGRRVCSRRRRLSRRYGLEGALEAAAANSSGTRRRALLLPRLPAAADPAAAGSRLRDLPAPRPATADIGDVGPHVCVEIGREVDPGVEDDSKTTWMSASRITSGGDMLGAC